MLYCYPRLSDWDLGGMRLGGPGLGNLLFPWARAFLLARANGWPLLQPTWPQFKLGPYLRREPDARSYQGLFQALAGEVCGLHKLALLLMAPRLDAADVQIGGKRGSALPRHALVTVSGMAGLFDELLGQDAVLHEALYSMLRAPVTGYACGADWLATRSRELQCERAVAVHVRFGDFLPADESDSQRGGANRRQPIGWYVAAVRSLQARTGVAWRFHVFSDASTAELGELLALRGVHRIQAASAAHDLLLMARHRALIASGSTFSMWASFLGQLPTLWYPGQRKFSLVRMAGAECEFRLGDNLGPFAELLMRENSGHV